MPSDSNTNPNTSSATAPPSASDDNTTPSLLSSHASYAKGAAEATVGSLTANAALQRSGDATKQQAVEDMRAAASDATGSPDEDESAGSGSGSSSSGGLAAKAEQAVGGVVGCEGLKAQGREKEAEGKVKEA